MTNEAHWQIYLLRCADGSLYTGIAADLERRLAEHRSQGPKCAKYLRGRTPLSLAFSAPAHDRAEASRWENVIKRLCKADKEALVGGTRSLSELLARNGWRGTTKKLRSELSP